MRKFFLVMILVLAGTGWLAAQEQEFTFALPEIEGRISLGVFKENGELVRTLNVGATEKDFVIGLNGLISKWDGKDDAGTALPTGKYFIRGYVIGNKTKPEGIAFHFNDWIADEDSPAIRWLEDFDWLPDGRIFALASSAEKDNSIAFTYQKDSGFGWQKDVRHLLFSGSPPPVGAFGAELSVTWPSPKTSRPMLTANNDSVFVLAGSLLFRLDSKNGEPLDSTPFSGQAPIYFAAEENDLFVGTKEGITRFSLPKLKAENMEKTSAAFGTLAVKNDRLIAGSAAKEGVWIGANGAWSAVEIPALVSSVDFGNGDTFWVVGKNRDDGKLFVGQFSEKGEFLRSYRGDLDPKQVRAGRAAEEIAVLEESATTQHLAVLKMVENSGWEIVLEKTIERCDHFGLKAGKLVAETGDEAPSNEVKLQLSSGGLTNNSPSLTVNAVVESDGLWLKSKAGLKLLRVTEHAGLNRVALQKPGENLQIYAGDGTVVAEYEVGNLSQIAEIDAGEVDLP